MKLPGSESRLPGSFRDPSGHLFSFQGSLFRQVNKCYAEEYDHLMASGLYSALIDSRLLVQHEEVKAGTIAANDAYKVIKPETVPFISYPYEWCFSQLKDAALVTLRIQKAAMDFGMSLKDSSAYNIQFLKGSPLLIDTLSFERYREGSPWVAYRQFCQHFLAPLALMSYTDIRFNQLFRIYMDGVPLDLASALLPLRTYAAFPFLSHIHLHSKYQKRYSGKPVKKQRGKMSRMAFLGVIDSLESSVKGLRWKPAGTEWDEYYDRTNYSADALEKKKELVSRFLDRTGARMVWDLGANTGVFSRIAREKGMQVISFDLDPACVEKNYLACVRDGESGILPLLMDLTNPSTGIGWAHCERMSFSERGPADTALALALIHHLAISNNIPLDMVAEFFSRVCRSLVIEFVPKEDSQVQRLLSTREDVFHNYDQQGFEHAFRRFFEIRESVGLEGSKRTLYLMFKKDSIA